MPKEIFWLVGGFGSLFLIVGLIVIFWMKKRKKNCTVETVGKVVKMVDKAMYVEAPEWHPMIEYTIGGEKIVQTYPYGTSSKTKYSEGQEIRLLYNSNNYNEYYIEEDNIPKILSIIFTSLGVLIIGLDILFYFR